MRTKVKEVVKAGRFLIPCRIYGTRGPQLICINGVQQSMAMWTSLVKRFSRSHRIVLFDFPNQGRAKILSGPRQVTLDEQVEILLAVMKATDINPHATMCAASWGGVVAVAFAAKYRDRIGTLILASLGSKPNKKMVETIKKAAGIDLKDRDKMAQVILESFGEDLPAPMKQQIVNQFKIMDKESLEAFYEHGLFVISSKGLGEAVDLKSVKAKTILLTGEKDTIIDLDDVKFLATQIPDCKIITVKGVGHFLHMEREDVLDVYADILSKIE